jgi:hypothetical protein
VEKGNDEKKELGREDRVETSGTMKRFYHSVGETPFPRTIHKAKIPLAESIRGLGAGVFRNTHYKAMLRIHFKYRESDIARRVPTAPRVWIINQLCFKKKRAIPGWVSPFS